MSATSDNARVNKAAGRLFLFACSALFVCLVLEFGVNLSPIGWYWLRRCEIITLGLIDLGLIIRLSAPL